MTPSEIIELALVRTMRPEHIKQADIDAAKARYVEAYISGNYQGATTYYNNYVKPVIAYGVIVDIWPAISVEVSDRGVQQLVNQGATRNDEAANAAWLHYSRKLARAIDLMQRQAPSGITAKGIYSEDILIATAAETL
jgi:hypothetical protein